MIARLPYRALPGRLWLWLYLGVVHLSAIGLLSQLLSQAPTIADAWRDLVFWFAVSFFSHLIAFEVAIFGKQVIRFSVGYAASTACIILFPPGWAALVVGISSISWPQLSGKSPLHKVLFNRSMFILSAGLAAVVFRACERWLGPVGPGALLFLSLVASFVYFLVNVSLVTLAVAISSQQSPARVWVFADSLPLFLSYVTLGIMGTLLAAIYTNIGWWGVIVASIPLIANYHALRYISLLRQSYAQVVQALGDTLDFREYQTAGHSLRVGAMARRLGEEMKLTKVELEHLYLGGILHDVGKIALDDKILTGSERLTDEEWQKVRQHPSLGSRLLEPYPHLHRAAAIVRHHHERFDGRGYPGGLKGDDIPLGARIVAVVDAFDVMYFGRAYQTPRTWEATCAELERCAGAQFDPRVVQFFLKIDRRQILAAIPQNALPEGRSHAH